MNIILLFLEYPGPGLEARLPLMLSCAQDLAQATQTGFWCCACDYATEDDCSDGVDDDGGAGWSVLRLLPPPYLCAGPA